MYIQSTKSTDFSHTRVILILGDMPIAVIPENNLLLRGSQEAPTLP
jgi:hypothetical protein